MIKQSQQKFKPIRKTRIITVILLREHREDWRRFLLYKDESPKVIFQTLL